MYDKHPMFIKVLYQIRHPVNLGQQSANRDQPPTKKKKVESSSDWMASDVSDIHDIDLEVYGTKMDDLHHVPSTITSYNFDVRIL